MFYFRKKRENDPKLIAIFKEAGYKMKEAEEDILFVVSDVVEGIQKRLAEFIGVDERHLPTLRLLDPSNMKKYLYEGTVDEMSIESLAKFVDDFKNQMLTPFMRS